MLYLLLIALWPLFNYLDANFYKLGAYHEISIIALVLVATSSLLFCTFKKIIKLPVEKMILPSFIGVLMFFGYGKIMDTIGPYISIRFIKLSYIYLIVFIGTIYIMWRISSKENIQKLSKILVSVVFSTSILNLTYSLFINYNNKTQKKTFSEIALNNRENENSNVSFTFKHRPNVYYILVDAYARQDTLKELTGYDNEPFLRQLEKMAFAVSRQAQSNYHFTVASLSATMNMDYHIRTNETYSYLEMQKSLRGLNKVRTTFRKNGYKIINMPAHWQEISCYGNEDICIKGNSYEIYESFLSATPLRSIKCKIPTGYVDLDLINKNIINSIRTPKFVFVHIAQVHDSVFDESGKFQSRLHPCFSSKDDSLRYVSSIKTMNKALLDFITKTRSNDPHSVIIIQADHGPTYVGSLDPPDPNYWLNNSESIRLKNRNDVRNTFGIFSAIYIPQYDQIKYANLKEYFSGSFSLINTFRYLFSYLSDLSPALALDKSHFLYYDYAIKNYREDDITHLTMEEV